MERIDTLDKKILEIVMNNARIPSKDVAQVCGVSRAAVHQRIQRLIDDGVITGSGYNVNPKLLGYSTCTFIGLTLERGSMYRNVVPELLKIKEVVECHFTTGPYTIEETTLYIQVLKGITIRIRRVVGDNRRLSRGHLARSALAGNS